MKKIINGVLLFGTGVGVLTAGLYLTTLSLPLGLILAATSVVPITKSSEEFSGNEIKNSIFSVSKNGNIGQSTLAHPLKMFSILKKKDKNKVFLEETLNMFTQLKDEDITYKTKSHAMTLMYLKKLKENGYIENLKYKPIKKSRLVFEKLLIGNIKGLFTKGKSTIFDISFKITGKKKNKDDLLRIYDSNETKEKHQSAEEKREKKEEIIKPVVTDEIIEKKVEEQTISTPKYEIPEERKKELEEMFTEETEKTNENNYQL